MSRVESAYKSFLMSKWFIEESWSFMTGSRIKFFIYFIPAYFRFMILTYKDYRKC